MIATGGNYIVYGPDDSMIRDNNQLALALILIVPILNYLRLHTRHRIIRLGIVMVMLLTLGSIIGLLPAGVDWVSCHAGVSLPQKPKQVDDTMMLKATLVGVAGFTFDAAEVLGPN